MQAFLRFNMLPTASLIYMLNSVSADIFAPGRKKLRRERATGEDYHLDSVIYESWDSTNDDQRRDVTREVNKMMRHHGTQDITNHQTFLERFGEVAYGRQKRLRVQKGDVLSYIYEDDAGNDGKKDAMYALPDDIVAALQEDAGADWNDTLTEPVVTVGRALLKYQDQEGAFDVTDAVNQLIRMHGVKNFTAGKSFKSIVKGIAGKKPELTLTLGNLTVELVASSSKAHAYNIPSEMLTEAHAKLDEQAIREVVNKPGHFACRRPKHEHRLWEGMAGPSECRDICAKDKDCMFYSNWPTGDGTSQYWCRLTPSCLRLQALPARTVTILADETKRNGCFYRCQGLDRGGQNRCSWKACAGCNVCRTSDARVSVVSVPSTTTTAELTPTPEAVEPHEPEGDAASFYTHYKARGATTCSIGNYALSKEEVRYAKCPPGSAITGKQNATEVALRESRLRDAICAAKHRGWKGWNERESTGFQARGYATFESSMWPKDSRCRTLPNEAWSKGHPGMPKYRPDSVPKWMPKYVNKELDLEFHENWKVASNSFPEYLRCEYGENWAKVPNARKIPPGRIVAVAVRHPVDRFVSAASELLERAVNQWCPSGPCNSTDAFDPEETIEMMLHTTTWLRGIGAATGGYKSGKLPMLMESLVHDASCNYATYASEHLSSQSNFVTQNEGAAATLSVVVKLEHIDKGLQRLANRVGKNLSGNCDFARNNVKEEKPFAGKVPSSRSMVNYLHQDDELMKKLCLTYAQDFVCFDYSLPAACEGMF